jgi:ABC-2 type transport system ATP-binding protein
LNILQTNNLSRSFGNFKAVDDLNITVEQQEIFALIGPNGAGKTTTIKMLTTLLPVTSGDALINGISVKMQPNKIRKMIGYVPQMLSADGSLTGYENLLLFAKLYDIPNRECRKRVNDALDFMGLSDSGNKLVKEYSGGMIRRLEIAQSMMHHPKLLFLDEPTTGLDPVARKIVWEHIVELQKEFGTTIVMTTHMMEEADELCNRVALMSRGKLVALDTPANLKSSLHIENATLEDVFIHFSEEENAENAPGDFKEISRERRRSQRLS